MAWLRCVTFPLLPLFVLTPDRPVAQAPGRTSFPPAEVPPRNDIRVDNRVGIPMRDGVILYADVYRPVGDGRFPVLQFDRNPNTGAKFGATKEVRAAQQTVHHDVERPSHILLPVIPARKR